MAKPAFFSAFSVAGIGPIPMRVQSTPATALLAIVALMANSFFSANDWLVTSNAAAPSEKGLLVAAVTEPPSTKAGFKLLIFSTSGLRGDPDLWAYNASKAAVINLVRAASVDLGPRGIRINAICPGPTETGMTERALNNIEYYEDLRRRMPLQRWGTPDEIASVISFLISTQASIVTGAVVTADGGMSANAGQFFPKEKS